jgi:hypothetical protein
MSLQNVCFVASYQSGYGSCVGYCDLGDSAGSSPGILCDNMVLMFRSQGTLELPQFSKTKSSSCSVQTGVVVCGNKCGVRQLQTD